MSGAPFVEVMAEEAITANADPWDAANYLAQGMDGVVEKPIKAERLLSAISSLFLQDAESVAA